VLAQCVPGVSKAWNSTGHRAIASIAYDQLDESTRKKVAEILKHHPAYATLWTGRHGNGGNADLNLFWNASLFPDDARGEAFQKYGRSAAHYVNYRIMADEGSKVLPPLDGENVLNSYVAHRKAILDPGTSLEDRALHLSWIFHQAGDVHQPLHAVARFSKAIPNGDRGGNGVTIPNPRARGDRGNNLHAYWDDALGTDDSPEAVAKLAAGLESEYPRDSFTDELKKMNIRDWAEESVDASLKTVYHDLDPGISNYPQAPIAYDADAQRVARRRAALAGYRLAEDLKALVAQP
jgi:hypothetical protein